MGGLTGAAGSDALVLMVLSGSPADSLVPQHDSIHQQSSVQFKTHVKGFSCFFLVLMGL